MKSETLLLLFLLWIKDQVQCVPNFLPTCQTVSVPVCSELTLNNKPNAEESEVQQWRYNTTVYPSFADDKSDADAILKLSHLHPLIATKCSSFIKIFLCSVHAPVCTTSGVVPPCRELCERVRDNCSHVAQMFDLDWPEVLNCDVFPRFKPNWKCNSNAAKDGLLSSNSENFLVSRVTPIIWSEALLADGNVCIPPSDDDVVSKALARLDSCEETTSKVDLELDLGVACPVNMKSPPDHYGYTFMGLPNCSAPCPNMYLTTAELWSVRSLILVIAILCVLITVFTLLTSFIDTERFRYPERPIVFYAFSYLIVSVVFLMGFGLGETAACHPQILNEDNEVIQGHAVVEGSGHRWCSIVFLVLYYFTVSGTIWWLILTITWLLAAGFSWGSEAIEERHLYYHAAAWGLPALQTLLVFIFNYFEGDNIAGVCFIGLHNSQALHFFVLLPMCTYLLTGLVNLFLGFFYLNRVRKKLTGDENNQAKLSKFMIRIGVFSILYIIPQVALIIIYVVEDGKRKHWEATWYVENCVENGVPCPVKDHPISVLAQGLQKPGLFIFCIKYVMTLIVALPPLFWVGNQKTLLSWKEFFTRKKSLKLNLNLTTTRLLTDCDDGPHARDRRRKLEGRLDDKEHVFGAMHETDHHGSSASVAAQFATKRKFRDFQPWEDTTNSDSSTYYSTSSIDSEMSRLIEFESKQNRGVRITGRKGENINKRLKKINPKDGIRQNRVIISKTDSNLHGDSYSEQRTVPFSKAKHSNSKLTDLTTAKVAPSGEFSKKDPVFPNNVIRNEETNNPSSNLVLSVKPQNFSFKSSVESRKSPFQETPSTSVSSSHISGPPTRPSRPPPPPPPPPRVESAAYPERTLSI